MLKNRTASIGRSASSVAAVRIRNYIRRLCLRTESRYEVSVLCFLACFQAERVDFVLLSGNLCVLVFNAICNKFVMKCAIVCILTINHITEARAKRLLDSVGLHCNCILRVFYCALSFTAIVLSYRLFILYFNMFPYCSDYIFTFR